jgi:hypothetical protein
MGRPGKKEAWTKPEGTRTFLIYSNEFQTSSNGIEKNVGPTKIQKFQTKYRWKEFEIMNNFSYRNFSRFEMEFELKFRELFISQNRRKNHRKFVELWISMKFG